MEQLYLAHHGILGQKWGIRRFQNKDGTRTELGKKREREDHNEDETSEKSSKTSSKESIKRAMIIGASVAAAGLAAYGGYKIATSSKSSGSMSSNINVGKQVMFKLKQNAEDGFNLFAYNAKESFKTLPGEVARELGNAPGKFAEGMREGAKNAPKKVGKAIGEGAAIGAAVYVARKLSNDKSDDAIKKYNAFNKKNKISLTPFEKKKKEDEEDDD